jgi:hypothetical protein
MRGTWWALTAALALGACGDTEVLAPVGDPAAPRNVDAFYYAGSVTVTWELGPGWDGEAFRVYARRLSDADYFLIAEVTSCAADLCSYDDRNVAESVRYEYYVASVDPSTGVETPSEFSVEVAVPSFTPPPAPAGMQVVALDGANYLRWGQESRQADDFSFYRVYLEDDQGEAFLLGETDSEGFLDELAANGGTVRYFVTALDIHGHESGGSGLAAGTPRPDFHGEWMWASEDRPELAGFRFQEDESLDPIVDGTDPARHFRLEVDSFGWWLVPGPGATVHGEGFPTTALTCGPGADAGCVDVPVAPASGYTAGDVELVPQTTYVLRVTGDDGAVRYGAVRVALLGFDQNDDAIMIFDWAYQSQAGNPNLAPTTSGLPLR